MSRSTDSHRPLARGEHPFKARGCARPPARAQTNNTKDEQEQVAVKERLPAATRPAVRCRQARSPAALFPRHTLSSDPPNIFRPQQMCYASFRPELGHPWG